MTASLLSGHWLPLVLNTVLQSLFVLTTAGIALACARKASAARRHLISAAALGALFLMPLLSLLIPAPTPLLQVSGPGLTPRRSSPVGTLSALIKPQTIGVAKAAPGLASAPSHHTEPPRAVTPSPPDVIFSPQSMVDAAHAAAAASLSLSRFALWVMALWLTGVLLVLGRLLIGLERLRRIAGRSDAVLPQTLQRQIQELLSEVGFTRPLTLLQASRRNPVSVAMTWGLRKATLLLPAEAAQWPGERLRVVVLHELAHIRRHDWLTQTFGQVVCAFYWFHPLVWLLQRHAQIEAEHACDDAVLLAGVRAKDYAAHLLEVVRAMQAGREAPSAAVAMARPTQVRYRMQSILDARRSRKAATRSVRSLVLLATGLLLGSVSLLRPLAWANAHRQATAPTLLPAIGPVVYLPNDISVELVAVGPTPPFYGEGDWWTPDGKALLKLPTEQTLPFASREYGYPDRLLRRALFFRLQVDPSVDKRISLSATGYVVDPTRHLQTKLYRFGHNDRTEEWILPPRATAGTLLLGLPQTETRCTYRLGIASSPWETIATTRFSLHAAPGAISIPATAYPNETNLIVDNTPRISYRDPRGKEHFLSLLGGHAPLGEVARRIVALDKNGKELYFGQPSNSVEGSVLPLPLWAQARIIAMQLQTRPYHWAEFKDIVLQPTPAAKPAAIATPPALPAFRHTFACGITLALPAVTESRGEGGRWWRPDGKPLPGPLKKVEWNMGDFVGWNGRIRPRGLALRLTSPRTLSYTSAVRFVPSAPDESDAMSPGEESTIEKGHPLSYPTIHDFPPYVPRAALRYGIAAGPWKTVAVISMPQDVLHADDNGNPEGGGVTVSVPGYPKPGDLPTLEYKRSAGKFLPLPFKVFDTAYLSDVARRFVAVDRAGHLFPLRSNNASESILDKAGKPILLNPANTGKLNLVAGDYLRRELDMVDLSFDDRGWMYGYNPVHLRQIREFRLQIRPYEWAELRGIALQPTKGDSVH